MTAARAGRLLLVAAVAATLGFTARMPALEVDDSPGYLEPARSWAGGLGLREEGRPLESRLPLYPLALGLLDRTVGASASAIAFLNAGCHILAVFLVRAVLRRRLRHADADVVAAAAIAYPPLVTTASVVLQESLLSLLLALVFVALWRAVDDGGVVWSGAAGVAFGLSGLAKVTALPLVVPAAILVALSPMTSASAGAAAPRASLRLARLSVLLLATALVLAPWALRNQRVLGRLEVTNANGGHTFLGGTVSNTVSDWMNLPEYVAARRAWEGGDRVAHPVLDHYLYRVALGRIAAAPGRWAGLVLERAARFLLPPRHWAVAAGLASTGTFPPWYLFAIALNVALFGAAAYGGVMAARRRDLAGLVGPLIVFGHQAVYAATYVSPRYAVTVGPVLFGAVGLALATRAASPRPGSPS